MIAPRTLGFALAFAPVIAAPAPASADFDFREGEASPAAQSWRWRKIEKTKEVGGWKFWKMRGLMMEMIHLGWLMIGFDIELGFNDWLGWLMDD